MATRNDMTNIVAYMKLAFPNYNPIIEGKLTIIDVLSDLLGDIAFEELQLAVKACCSERGRAFAPSPGEIRGKIADLRLKANNTPNAGEAWAEVMHHIKYNGCRAKPSWTHPIIGKAVDAIGLENIGMSEDAMVERAHFLKIYPTYLKREEEEIAEHPQITAFIDERRQLAGNAVKLLADKMSFKK